MIALVVVAHPVRNSFCWATADAAVTGLRSAGHDVELLDLYDLGFRAAMNLEERRAYESDDPILDPMVAAHADLLKAAEIVVFVYPTWWSGMPAILKGWLDRVLVPGVAFTLDEQKARIRPALTNVRRIVGISSYGSPRLLVALVTDNGRRTLTRAFRMACGVRTRSTWIGMYGMDHATESDRKAHLQRVEQKLAAR